MYIGDVANIISKIAEGVEEACIKCLSDNSGIVVLSVTEQLICGQDGKGELLTPTYDDDPYFEEKGIWYHRNEDYKKWKMEITPPRTSGMLSKLPPRPDEVPNLTISNKFHREINAKRNGNVLDVDPGKGDGPAIVEKYAEYGHDILTLGPTAVEYFNETYMLPAIQKHFANCGYK